MQHTDTTGWQSTVVAAAGDAHETGENCTTAVAERGGVGP
ncbi:MAG: hypothetical protein J07HB67_02539 [halophilic archaeon J07HB67]|nr:MAG: hypothetical protein J07HB67_02539 [halophilic archaeon J07HB67]